VKKRGLIDFGPDNLDPNRDPSGRLGNNGAVYASVRVAVHLVEDALGAVGDLPRHRDGGAAALAARARKICL